MTKDELLQIINSNITDNNSGDITAEKLRNTLNAMVEINLDGYLYISTATPSTTPVALAGDEKVFYIATEEGDYSKFGLGIINELSIIKSENGSWKAEGLGIGIISKIPIAAERIIENRFISLVATLTANELRSIALFNIESFKDSKIDVLVPRTATNYAMLYAYSNNGSKFYAPFEPIESPITVPNYAFSIDSAEDYKYLAISYTAADGVPTVVVNQNKYYTKQEVDDIISAVEERIDSIEESLQGTNIAPSEIMSLKYINSSSIIKESSYATIAFYNIKGIKNVKVHVPESGNEYSILYAYSDEIVDSGEIIAPENIIEGNSSGYDFIIPNSFDMEYAVICFTESAGLPTVTTPTYVEMLELKIDDNTKSDKSIIRSIANNKKSDVCDKIRPMKVLFIANSFAVQATDLLPKLLKSKQRDIIIGISYVGGGTLKTHDSLKDSSTKSQYVKYKGGEWVYEASLSVNTSVYDPSNTYNIGDHCKYDSNGGTTYTAYRCIKETSGEFDPSCWTIAIKSNTLIDKLDDENWDVVFFLQASAYAGLYSSYEPYFSSLLGWLPSKIQSLGYKVGWFMPWACSNEYITTEGDNQDGGVTHDEMYVNICSATEQNITTHKDDIDLFCPCGTAVENQLNYYSNIWADGKHTNAYGSYAAAMILYDVLSQYFFKEGLSELVHSPVLNVNETAFNNAKTSALNAIANPFKKTIV